MKNTGDTIREREYRYICLVNASGEMWLVESRESMAIEGNDVEFAARRSVYRGTVVREAFTDTLGDDVYRMLKEVVPVADRLVAVWRRVFLEDPDGDPA